MIQPQSYLNVADNSGARKLMCIQILGGSSGKYASIGDIIIAVVKDALPNMPLKKSDVVRAVIVRTVKGLRRENGMSIRFDDNAAVVINKEGNRYYIVANKCNNITKYNNSELRLYINTIQYYYNKYICIINII